MRKLLSAMTGLASGMVLSSPALAQEIRNPAEEWEHLWNEVMLDITVIGVVMTIAALVMLYKYRATSPDQVGTAKKLTTVQSISFALIPASIFMRSEEHTSELQSHHDLVCRLLLEKKTSTPIRTI